MNFNLVEDHRSNLGSYYFCFDFKVRLRQLGGGHLHDLSNLVQVLVGVIATVETAMTVFHKTNRADYKILLIEKEAIINELKIEKNEFKKYYNAERKRRIMVEE